MQPAAKRACRGTHPDHPKGAALVELAVVLVLLITIVLGCVDFGRFASTVIAVNNAAREGASFGSTHPFTPVTQQRWKDQIVATIVTELSGLSNFRPEWVTVEEPIMHAEAVDENLKLRVHVQVTHEFHTAVPWPLIPRVVRITRSAVMPVVR